MVVEMITMDEISDWVRTTRLDMMLFIYELKINVVQWGESHSLAI